MNENETQDVNANETPDMNTNETTNAPQETKETKEMPEKTRKIVGIVIMAVGAIIAVIMSPFAGVIVLLGGMWAYNPEVKGDDGKKTVSTWAGTLLIIAVVVVLAWAYKAFMM